MDKYISQIIEDIGKIVNDDIIIDKIKWQNFDNESVVEQYLEGQQSQLQQIVGLPKESLPPLERLSDDQVSKLLPWLVQLLQHHNYELAFPDILSNRTKYKLLYQVWETDKPKTNYGRIGIEFCSYMIEDCPIPGECKGCEELAKDFKPSEFVDSKIDFDIENLLPEGVTIQKKTSFNEAKVRESVRSFKPKESNIDGIFNYCDRWCERCLFTDRCSQFDMEQEMGLHDDHSMEDALKYTKIIFEEIGSMLSDKMKEFNIGIDEEIDLGTKPDFNDEDEHLMETLAMDYLKRLSEWLELNNDHIDEKASHLWNISQNKYDQFDEALNVVHWYMSMIPVKMKRGLKKKDKYDDDDFFWEDKNAIGKLLLMCIEKSIKAFALLFDYMPEMEDDLIDFMAILSQMKSGVQIALPNANKFIRKGLDE
ncbi:MAG: hypothetical protein PF517_11130 [Salinivirgaceae bacterium]|jgi:hypothetical protein|nr:hypothetical protein [Salinivirgaceae bacterium]